MKKFLCVVLSLLAVTGCATSSKTSVSDNTTEITSSEGTSGTDLSDLSVTYSKEDFVYIRLQIKTETVVL